MAKGELIPWVSWRFYGGLNDFLPRERRGLRFGQPLKPAQVRGPVSSDTERPQLWFQYGQTIKDAFEALGVPHPEVGTMVVNGRAVSFEYQLTPGDEVWVYPHGAVPVEIAADTRMPFLPEGRPRFILDVHLGALVRYMRLAGFDCLYSARDWGDAQIAALACQQQRVVLTRDVGLLKRNQVTWGYRPRQVRPRAQFREVVEHFNLGAWFEPFNRCSVCNSEDLVRVSRALAAQQMPVGLPPDVEELWQCRDCGKIYWQGSHYDRIQGFLAEMREGRRN